MKENLRATIQAYKACQYQLDTISLHLESLREEARENGDFLTIQVLGRIEDFLGSLHEELDEDLGALVDDEIAEQEETEALTEKYWEQGTWGAAR